MQQKNSRYNCYWDISNQNKKYTKQEKRFIKQSYKNGMSVIEIAKRLKRGYWAIKVQIFDYGVVKRKYQTRPTKPVKKQNVKKYKKKLNQSKMYKRKRFNLQNRKFKNETNNVIETSKNEIENHVKDLMGL